MTDREIDERPQVIPVRAPRIAGNVAEEESRPRSLLNGAIEYSDLRDVDKLADTVRVNLGPKGRNVIVDKKFGAPTITSDEVTTAREVEFNDPFENRAPRTSPSSQEDR